MFGDKQLLYVYWLLGFNHRGYVLLESLSSVFLGLRLMLRDNKLAESAQLLLQVDLQVLC